MFTEGSVLVADDRGKGEVGSLWLYMYSPGLTIAGQMVFRLINPVIKHRTTILVRGWGVAQSPADAVKSRAPRPAGEYPDPRGATDLEAGVVMGRRREPSDSGRPYRYRVFFHVSWRKQK